jgi:hypothetical protein
MGYVEQPDGSLVFTEDAANPVGDLQRAHTYAKRFAMFRDGTRDERENLPIEQRRNGMRWFETDTESEWRLIGDEWRQSNSFQSRFRSIAMNITSTQSRMDWNGVGASFGVPDFSYSGGMFTCVQPGIFQLTGQVVALPAGLKVAFVVLVYKNGDLFFRAPANTTIGAEGGGSVAAVIATAVECNVGDNLNVDVYANAAIGVDVAVGMNVFNIARVG